MKTMAQELCYKIDESTAPDWTAKTTANTQAEDLQHFIKKIHR
jgi:hypothetical protein